MTTLVQGVGIIRMGFQPLGVSGDEVLSRNSVRSRCFCSITARSRP